ncbi:MAG: molybdopterin molybdotransferase MoeA [Planctomycetes bacterium]|nr:molybdopterin molybdotransferase MoeA [Planctomycetota bacterium]
MNNTQVIPLDDAFRIVDETLAGIMPAAETVSVREAIGRTLLADQVSRLDLPPFNKSAMDGYAIIEGDERDEYRLLETVPAGSVGQAKLVSGAAVKVMTGAAVPEGAGTVIMVEYTEEADGIVKVSKHGGKPNICLKAEDVRRGQTILSAGTTLDALDIANLIGCGVGEVEVAPRIRVAVISTGDEIVDSPTDLAPGKIMNSNGPMLAGLARRFGLEVVSEKVLPDDRAATVAGLRSALDRSDIVVFSGGVSVGDFDFVLDAISDVGLTVHFARVKVKPGKPLTYATTASWPPKIVFGLPGNPVSVFLSFHTFVLRAVALLSGARPMIREFTLRLAADFKRGKPGRAQYVPCRLGRDGTIEQIEFHGSAHLTALSQADGFFFIPFGVGALSAGNEVAFLPLMSAWK